MLITTSTDKTGLYKGSFSLVKQKNSQTHFEPIFVVHKVVNSAFFTKSRFLDQFTKL